MRGRSIELKRKKKELMDTENSVVIGVVEEKERCKRVYGRYMVMREKEYYREKKMKSSILDKLVKC